MRRIVLLILVMTAAACSRGAEDCLTGCEAVDIQSTAPDQPGLPHGASYVEAPGDYQPGDIVVDNSELALYLIQEDGAIRYPVGLGTESLDWTGVENVSRMSHWPSWTPTESMIARNSEYAQYAGGMPGGPNNPLGARAIYLGSTAYRIHGTPDASKIGDRKSNGCVNMFQSHVIDLYERVRLGATVYVIA